MRRLTVAWRSQFESDSRSSSDFARNRNFAKFRLEGLPFHAAETDDNGSSNGRKRLQFTGRTDGHDFSLMQAPCHMAKSTRKYPSPRERCSNKGDAARMLAVIAE